MKPILDQHPVRAGASVLISLLALLASSGCEQDKPAQPAAGAVAPAPVPPPPSPAAQEAPPKAPGGWKQTTSAAVAQPPFKLDPECWGLFGIKMGQDPIRMNKWTVYPQGYHWRVTEPRELFQHTLAVLADPPLDPEAAARAAQAVAGDSAKTDFFLIAGSITSSREGMERFLTPLLQTAKPVLILAGSSPPREEYLTAAANLSSRFGNLINLNRVRRFETQLLAILSVPGVYGEGREDVCAWGDKHPMGLKHLIAQSPLPVLLAGSDLFEPAAGELSAAPAIRKPMQELLASKPVPFVVSASAAPRPGAFDGKGKPVLGEAIPGGQAAAGRLADGWYLLAVYHSNGSMNFTARPIK